MSPREDIDERMAEAEWFGGRTMPLDWDAYGDDWCGCDFCDPPFYGTSVWWEAGMRRPLPFKLLDHIR